MQMAKEKGELKEQKNKLEGELLILQVYYILVKVPRDDTISVMYESMRYFNWFIVVTALEKGIGLYGAPGNGRPSRRFVSSDLLQL